ncbi:hypothetical protein [Anaerosacchariphilus polymeriproducens]|uniref:DUF5082 domain-containing protein n=1 Tax=Anaerosacchariphilus polymeriproducens TaxID=1812858 RepID=A0A371AW38_9FIRM|nr:hypothetical protein [Anaerosacchariphilus polymeriproducens]RDU23795.1 hypothetical protein DWV06_08025 [Anaerosacchariphilus polymeriproducens]
MFGAVNIGDKIKLTSQLKVLFVENTEMETILQTLEEEKIKLNAKMSQIINLQDEVVAYDISRNGLWQGTKEEIAENVKKNLTAEIKNYYDACEVLMKEINAAIAKTNEEITRTQVQINAMKAQILSFEGED